MKAIERLETNGSIREEELQRFIELTLGPQLKGFPKEQILAALQVAKVNNLNPWKREVYFIPYTLRNKKGEIIDRKIEIVTSYTVYISRASASGLLNGFKVDVDSKGQWAKVTIYRKNWDHPFEWIVFADEVKRDTKTWEQMPKFMLRKVAISQAFRLAFPEVIAGLPYTREELLGIDNDSSGNTSDNNVLNVITESEDINTESEDTSKVRFVESLFNKYPELAKEVIQKYVAGEDVVVESVEDAYSIWEESKGIANDLLPDFATGKQRKKIKVEVNKLGWEKETYRTFLKNTYGVSSSLILSKEEASDCIERLTNLQTLKKASEAEPPEEFEQFENCEAGQ